MPIYHLHVKTGSRTNGASAKSKAQYIQREAKYENQQDRCLYKESEHMPEWAEEHATDYWEAADTYERANGRLYKEVELALPRELDQDQQIELARAFAHDLTDDENLPYTLAVHEGGGDNPHAHVLISERMNDDIERDKDQWFSRFNRDEPELGGAEKTTSLKPKEWLEQTREDWAKEVNQALEREGYDLSIDHRSLEEQGIDRVPQMHLGVHALAMEERGLETERGDRFQEIEELNKGYELERSQQLEDERALEHSPERDHDLERTHDYGYDLDY
jgi:hypothetical protein